MSAFDKANGRIVASDASAGESHAEFDAGTIEATANAVDAAPSSHDPNALIEHARAGHELIALIGKRPAAKGWRRLPPLSLIEAKARMASGGNVGIRLRATDLVIDVDPRNFDDGDDPLFRLKRVLKVPDAPLVRTGGGGLHLYLRKPAEIEVVHSLPRFKGIEFKSLGRQVVAAGSVHPETGALYALDDDPLRRALVEAPEASDALLNAIRKPSGPASSSASGEITPEQLEKLLMRLDVIAYNRRHDEWLKIMMACHHGTAGAGVEEFVAWSTGDPDYALDAEAIRRRWRSLSDKPNGVTLATLLKALSDAGHGAWIEEVLRAPAEEDFAGDVPAEIGRPLFTENRGRIEATYRNTQLAIEAGNFDIGFDELSQRAVLRAERLPWTVDIGRELNDDTIRIIREWVMLSFGFEPKREDLSDVLLALATKNTFNPVVDYLDGLTWDGVARIDRLFPSYFGAKDGEYERMVGRKFLIAAVRRMRRPGAKFDTVPIVEGKQGSGKTSGLRILGGEWHSDAELGRLDNKDSSGVLHGVWIMELGELTAMRKAEVDHLKAFVSRCEDRYRPPYGKSVKTYLRRCVFVGTTNGASYLRDSTGNRRYLPVATNAIDLEALRRDRDLLWAEASVAEAEGESLVLPSHLWSDAAEKQGDRLVDDPWIDRLRLHIASSPERTRFSSQELLEFALEVPCSRQNQHEAKRVATLMARLGWQHKSNVRIGSQSVTGYVSPEDATFKA